MDFRIRPGHIIPNTQVNKNREIKSGIETDFKNILNKKIEEKREVKISSHAQRRMLERNITLPKEDLEIIEKAIDKLDQKGAQESLMLYKDLGLITSVRNRTIITALDLKDIEVITNIDSAVIIK